GLLAIFIANGVIARGLMSAADSFFAKADALIDEGVAQPKIAIASGSPDSSVEWDSIGRRGKNFIVEGPQESDLTEFWGRECMQPVRVYVGLRSREAIEDRAKLALEELIRVDGFKRSTLIVATPTGTGWLDPAAVDSVEYLLGGDTAIVSMQYSYLPSWLTIIVDPTRSIVASQVLFDEIYDYWITLPEDDRPKLYLFGLSLGAFGSEVSADLYKVFDDPIQGAVWSGPPFPSTQWQELTRERNADSPAWLPRFRNGSMVRFTSQKNTLESGKSWGGMRNVYVQYASDPMVFFSPDLAFQKPAWLVGQRGPDVSPHLKWYPVITFLQIAFDLPMATSVPNGYGHNYSPSSYIDAWIAVTKSEAIPQESVERLKKKMYIPPF
ncbi:alpha/beta-hydrolase family protein, partial [bacterium]|nr:alpha/beta-hydrolase family protein [bacterium]